MQFSDDSLTAIGGLRMKTGVCWRFWLPEEVQKRTIRGGGQAEEDLISKMLREVMSMVMTAYVMVDMRGGAGSGRFDLHNVAGSSHGDGHDFVRDGRHEEERPVRKGEAVLVRADNETAVTWGKRCRGGGKKQALVGALMRMMGALEARRGWCSQARHVRGGRD